MDEQAIPISYLHPHWTSEADMGRKFNSSEDESVSASELAQMGVCERMVWFDHLYGRRFTPQRRMAAARGQRLHQHFYEQGIRQKQGTRCCVAAHVFGDPSPEVAALRKYRDEVLRSTRYGQVLISIYYSASPMACILLRRSEWLATITRSLLVVWLRHGYGRSIAGGRA